MLRMRKKILFSVPDGLPTHIHTGMYTLPDVKRIPKVGNYEDPLFPIEIDLGQLQ